MSGRIEPGANGRWVSYDYAVLRVVPHVYLGTFVPVGVMVHARTADFLGMRVLADDAKLRARVQRLPTRLRDRLIAKQLLNER